jgi:hypothetical protein
LVFAPARPTDPSERNIVEQNFEREKRAAAPHLYVPPGVEVRFDVVADSK